MNYEVVEIKEKLVVGSSVRTSNSEGGVKIAGAWQHFFSDVYQTINNKVDSKVIGIYTNYESDHNGLYDFICGEEVSAHDNELVLKEIKAGKYAKFSVHGDITKVVGEAWNMIWNMDLDRVYQSDFEVYHNDTDDPMVHTVDIYISIK